MKRTLRLPACLLAGLLAVPALANDEAVLKPVKLVLGAVRQGKDSIALKQFAGEEQGKYLLGDDWAKGTPAQRKEFTQLFQALFSKIAFPNIRDNFKHLDAVSYANTTAKGAAAEADSLILIDHPLKKQELKLQYLLAKEGGRWKVVDVKGPGFQMLKDIRDNQIRPIMAQGGWDHLLSLMRKKLQEVEAQAQK